MDGEMTYMWAHPPRCLGNSVASPSGSLQEYLRGLRDANLTYFAPVCECGSRNLSITRPVDFGVTSITCADCGKSRTLFDPLRHGYDGELGNNGYRDLGDVERHACSKCAHTTCEVAVAFQYCGETDVLEEPDAPEVRPEDLFGWMLVVSRCNECGAVQEVTQKECA